MGKGEEEVHPGEGWTEYWEFNGGSQAHLSGGHLAGRVFVGIY